MILTFEDDEKELYMNILNYVGNKMEAVQITDVSKSRKQYGELEVDLSRLHISDKRSPFLASAV